MGKMNKKKDKRSITVEEFIRRARIVHGDKYEYDKIKLINLHNHIKIFCNTCKKYFTQEANTHLRNHGCKACGVLKCSNARKSNTEEFIQKAIKVHGNRYIYDKFNYTGNHEKSEIICRIHGSFIQEAAGHLNGHGCPQCKQNVIHDKLTFTKNEFMKAAILIHGNKYNYDEFIYVNAQTKGKIFCNTCNRYFYQRPSGHINQKFGCSYCNFSKLELIGIIFCEKNNITYESQKKFDSCKDKRSLPFDLFIPYKNILIEFDGEQHHKISQISQWHDTQEKFNARKRRDAIKTKWAKKNGFKLIRISYKQLNKIEEILTKELLGENK